MKLLKLEIQNLASLEGQNVIDFEGGVLRDCHIFSIVGATGSGKSTLLDAICLALYGRAPRYPRKRGERGEMGKLKTVDGRDVDDERESLYDCRRILTRGQKAAYSKLTFLANDGSVYRAEWSVRIKIKNYEDAVTALYQITKDDQGKTQEELRDWNLLESSIVGLTFEQFLRTVLIAQGSFAKFLTATDEERFALLESLVGNKELYQHIVAQIEQRQSEAKERNTKLQASQSAYKENYLEGEQLQQLLDEISQLEAAERQLNARREAMDNALAWHNQRVSLHKYMNECLAAHQREMAAMEQLQPLANRLMLHDATEPATKTWHLMKQQQELMDRLGADQARLQQDLTSRHQQLAQMKEQLATLTQKEHQAQEEVTRHEPLIRQALTLRVQVEADRKDLEEKTAQLKAAETAHRQATAAVQKNADDMAAAQKQQQEAEAAMQQTEQQIRAEKERLQQALATAEQEMQKQELKLQGIDPEQLNKVKSDADALMHDLKEALRVATTWNDSKQSLATQQQHSKELAQQVEQLKQQLGKLTIEQLERDIEVDQQVLTLMTSENWTQHRQHLIEGEPCPLCGATHHPYATQEAVWPVVDTLQQHLDEKRTQLQAQRDSHKRITASMASCEGELHALASMLKGTEEAIAQAEQEWQSLQQRHAGWQPNAEQLRPLEPVVQECVEHAHKALTFYNNDLREATRLRQLHQQAAEARSTYDDQAATLMTHAEEQRRKAAEQAAACTALTGTLQQQQTERQQEMASALSAYELATKVLEQSQQSYNAVLDGREPEELEKQLRQAKEQAATAVEQQQQALNQHSQQLSETEGELRVTQEQHALAEKQLQAYDVQLGRWISDYNASIPEASRFGLSDIEALANATDDWEQIRDRVNRQNEAMTAASTTLQNAQRDCEAHEQSHPDVTALLPEGTTELPLEAEHLELQKQQDALAAESYAEPLAAKHARHQLHLQAEQELGNMAQEVAKASEALDDIMKIREAIGTNGKNLRKIAQCYTLRFLVAHANAEIRKFNSRYELEQIKDTLTLRVIDHDRGNDHRSTTSLSGGETFIVSLGLALGLSALSSRNHAFGNLFIDEGFGTLDPETLATVIDALSMMQTAQGKKVGVISHTDTMAERISTQIRVMRNGTTGTSRIEIVNT